MAQQGRWNEERARRSEREAPDYGRDFGAPYRGRGYERDTREPYRPAGNNGVSSYGSNYGGAPFRRDSGWNGPERFERDEGFARNARGGDENRDWWDRATDEVSAWFGDREASYRRFGDGMGDDLRGRGPKGYTRSDERIREEVCDRLSDDPFVDASDIEVTVAAGEVTLGGTASSRDEKRRAEDCADRVSGVRHVQNNVRVTRGAGAMDSGHAVTTSSAGSVRSATGTASATDPYSRGTVGSGATGGNPALGGGEGGNGLR